MRTLFAVVFNDELVKIFTTKSKAWRYIDLYGNEDYRIEEVNYE